VGGVGGKVLELMRMVGAIGKDRQTPAQMGGYKFRGIDDAMDAVGHAMRTIGLVYETEVIETRYSTAESRNSEGRVLLWTSAFVRMRYTFVDPEDGSRHPLEMVGEGRDNADKATSKAAAMALKYGLLHALMIPTNEMPDGDAEQPQITRPAEQPVSAPAAAQERDPGAQALRALEAIKRSSNLSMNEQRAELLRIQSKLNELGIAGYEVDGSKLSMHWLATWRTLPPADQQDTDQAGNGSF
jgi:hypothetical protein